MLNRLVVRVALFAAALPGMVAVLAPSVTHAQWSTTYEQFYLPGKFNWQFRENFPAADRLFNAFDFGHAILYETLWTDFDASVEALERTWYDRLTTRILVNPPRLPLEEAAIEIEYAKLAPEAKQMLDWAHVFHRQVYDVWADERTSPAEKDAKVAELLRYYKTRRDIAFSTKPKSMALMQEQRYALAFRQNYPKFNGLIWAYHWLQVGLYEPLVTARTVDEKQAGVRAAVARFWQMLRDPPRTMPHVMPMTAAVAPEFAKRYPEAAIIFDNLHSMHDVVSDILANPSVPRDRKRAEILLAARRYRDDTSFVIPAVAWRTTAQHMRVENMGGPAVGFLAALPTPTVTYGAVMTHDDRTGEMTGFKYGQATSGGHAAMQRGATPTDSLRRVGEARDSAGRVNDSTAVKHERHQVPDTVRRATPAPTGHAEHTARAEARPSSRRMPAVAGRTPAVDSAAVAATVDRYHRALAAGDSARALALLTSDAVILESGGVETREEYRSHHLPADIEFARAVKQVRGPVRVAVRGDVAWVSSTSTTEGQFRGRAVNSTGAELMVLVRSTSGWQIAAIHWSSRARRQ